MGFLAVYAVLFLCLSSALATYGPEYKGTGPGHYGGNGGDKEHKIHLNSPKIILDRPSINLHGAPASPHPHHHSPLLEDEPIILENEEPLYIRKTLHAAAPAHPHPVLLDSGYSHGKVLDITAPIQVINHAPIVQERPVLIRRPVIVSKALTTTQDHLEKLHYAHQYNHAIHHGYAHQGHAHQGYAHNGYAHNGYGHNGYAHGYAVPIARALHEKTVVYSGPSHHQVVPAVYSAPLILSHHHHAPKAHHAHAGLGHHHGLLLHGGVAPNGHGAPAKKY